MIEYERKKSPYSSLDLLFFLSPVTIFVVNVIALKVCGLMIAMRPSSSRNIYAPLPHPSTLFHPYNYSTQETQFKKQGLRAL